MNNKTFIIAEAGVNHNGDIKLAKKLIDAAVLAKVDAIKFQTWKTELIVTETAEMAQYQKDNTQSNTSQFNLLKQLELSYEDFTALKNYCDVKNILFLSTPDEEQSATFLADLQPRIKIGSGELTNIPFLQHIARLGKPVILSTGMAYLSEVEQALYALTSSGVAIADICILHATTDYPTAACDVNLHAMLTLKKAFPGVDVGYSDHTLGIDIPVAAVAMGASVIEKHFTLDKTLPGPDHKASLEPDELQQMVKAIRRVELALGHGWKVPTTTELKNRDVVRKSLVAACDMSAGEKMSEHKIVIKRPGNGISPKYWHEMVNTPACKDFKEGELITRS